MSAVPKGWGDGVERPWSIERDLGLGPSSPLRRVGRPPAWQHKWSRKSQWGAPGEFSPPREGQGLPGMGSAQDRGPGPEAIGYRP